jgi:Tfp pilus assembly protein PilV
MSHSPKSSQGFTLIELLLAMTFVSFILIFMALTLVQMIRTYDKGLTIKQINQAGRVLTEDISKKMRSELPGDINLDYVAEGRLCIGNIMYAWNPVYIGSRTSPTPNSSANFDRYTFSDGTRVTMARKLLTNPTDCSNPNQAVNMARGSETYSLLGDRARVLWAGTSINADGRLVDFTFILGTYDVSDKTSILSGATGNIFNTPYFQSGQPVCQSGSNGNYCSFNEFSTIVYLPNGE